MHWSINVQLELKVQLENAANSEEFVYLPAGQDSQVVEFRDEAKVPSGQMVHTEEEVELENRPTWQLLHAEAPERE